MIECYSKNVSVAQGEPITLNNTTIKKGCTVEVSGATIQFNKCGIYELTVDASMVVPSASSSAADASIQLLKDGVPQPQAVSTGTAESDTAKVPLGFTTLVQVSQSNSCSMCTAPTTCTIVNTGTATTADLNLVVTKLV